MKALIFLAVASLLLVPSVAAEPEPPCKWTDTGCWWGIVEGHTPFPVCEDIDHYYVWYLCTYVIGP